MTNDQRPGDAGINPQAIAIVGPGRLGSSLAAAVAAAGPPLVAVAGRHSESSLALARALGRPALSCTPAEAVGRASVVFLAVPDGHVETVCAGLPWRAGHLAAHCSGALGLDALAVARSRGADTGCLHPVQSFPSPTPDPTRFHGIHCGVECTGNRAAILEDIVRSVRATPFSLAGVDRALYHAAAVFVGNDVVALMTAAARAWSLAGLPAALARDALAPLLIAAATNATRMAPAEALTGPIARGDATTVTRHLAALESAPPLRALYVALASELLREAAAGPRPGRDEILRLLAEPQA